MIVDKNKIKAVIFDWGGVCCQEGEPFASKALQKVLAMNPDQIADQSRDLYNSHYTGEFIGDAFWQTVIKHFGLKETSEINPAALREAYLNSYLIYQDVLDLALRLQSKYRIALLSNLAPEMRDHIRITHQTEKYFKPEVYSCDPDVKSMKPGPKPYQVILEKLNLPGENCLFIDNSEKNVETAQHLNIQTILFQSPQQLLDDLKPLLKICIA